MYRMYREIQNLDQNFSLKSWYCCKTSPSLNALGWPLDFTTSLRLFQLEPWNCNSPMDEDWRNAFGILMCTEICDGAGAGICDSAPSTCSSTCIYSAPARIRGQRCAGYSSFVPNQTRMFVFVLRFYGPVNPMGSCQARSVCLTTSLLGRTKSSKRLTSIVHILSPETDNCPSWISRRERMTIENISWSVSTKECINIERL